MCKTQKRPRETEQTQIGCHKKSHLIRVCGLLTFSFVWESLKGQLEKWPRSDATDCGVWSVSILFVLTTAIPLKHSKIKRKKKKKKKNRPVQRVLVEKSTQGKWKWIKLSFEVLQVNYVDLGMYSSNDFTYLLIVCSLTWARSAQGELLWSVNVRRPSFVVQLF